MHIKNLKIENFRGIREMELELHPKMNIFIGVNGAGKSSVLDAIGYLLRPLITLFNEDAYIKGILHHEGNDFPDSEVTIGETEARLGISMLNESHQNFPWELRTSRAYKKVPCQHDLSCTQAFYNHARELISYLSSMKEGRSLCSIVYYRTHRAVEDVPIEAWRNRSFDIRDAYKDALAKTDFREFFEWFRNREDLENELLAEGDGASDSQLEAVRKALSIFLDTVSNVRIRRRDPLRMVVKKNEEEIRIEQLSDGEKCLLALVGDLSRRLAIANPTLKNPLQGEGVVLIDEVDLHLHPQWQRMILPKMMETFPNCQFIVSTHSPQILGEMRSEYVTILAEGENGIEARKPAYEIYGQTSDVILADIMDTPKRQREIESQLKQLFDAIGSGDLTEARKIKSSLESQAKDIPEYARIELLMHRKEKLGK